MATQYRQLQEFQPDLDSIQAYLERASLYFVVNAIDDDKKAPNLLSSIGASTYALLSDLLAPTPPGNKSFADIAAALRNHFEPKHSVIAERFHFHNREQGVDETITEFNAALRKLVVYCQFGETLETPLCDRFVCELRHDAIQR